MSPEQGGYGAAKPSSLIDVYVNVNLGATARSPAGRTAYNLRANHMPGNIASTKITVSSCPISSDASAVAGL